MTTYANKLRLNNSRNSFRPKANESNQDKEKKAYLRQKGKIEHKKILKMVNEDFNEKVKEFITFNDILSMRIRNNRVYVTMYWFRHFPDNTDWLEYPQRCINKISSICPLFKRLSVWISGQSAYGKNNKFVKCDFMWTNNKYDIEESGMDSFESMYVAIKLFKQEMDRLKIEESTAYNSILGRDFNINRSQRYWNCDDGYKYIMNEAYIPPELNRSRDPNKDTTANLVKVSIKNKYSDANIQVSRLGSMRGKFVPRRLLVLSSTRLEMEWLSRNCRRVNGQRVTWEEFQDGKEKEERKEQTNEQRLNEFKRQKMEIGKHKEVQYSIRDGSKGVKTITIAPGDYTHYVKFWKLGDEAFESKELKDKMKKMYGGIDGNAWITNKIISNDHKFISFSKQALGLVVNHEKEMVDDDDDDDNLMINANSNISSPNRMQSNQPQQQMSQVNINSNKQFNSNNNNNLKFNNNNNNKSNFVFDANQFSKNMNDNNNNSNKSSDGRFVFN